MLVLKNWYLETFNDMVLGHGEYFGNPKFPEGLSILTSPIRKIENDQKNEHLRLFTGSGRCYILEYAEIKGSALCEPFRGTKQVLEKLGIGLDFEKCLGQKWKNDEDLRNRLLDELDFREMYVQMAGANKPCRAYYKSEAGEVMDIPVRVLEDMFEIKVSICGAFCDWRFAAYDNQVECYHWDGKLDNVRLENIGNDFYYKGIQIRENCMQGESIIVPREEFDSSAKGVDRKPQGPVLSQPEIDIVVNTVLREGEKEKI